MGYVVFVMVVLGLALLVGFVQAVGYLRQIRDAVVRMAPDEGGAGFDGPWWKRPVN